MITARPDRSGSTHRPARFAILQDGAIPRFVSPFHLAGLTGEKTRNNRVP